MHFINLFGYLAASVQIKPVDQLIQPVKYLAQTALFFFFFLRMQLRPIVGQPGSSSIISRVKLGQNTVQLRTRAGFDDVGHRLGLTTGAQISVFLQTPQCP